MGPWLIIGLGDDEGAPPAAAAGFQSLLGFWIGGIGSSSGAVTPSATVGWIGRRHTHKELEEKLKRQRDNTFGRRWFKEFLNAQEAALERAAETKSEKAREALVEAVVAIQEVVLLEDDAEELTRLLNAAANATRVTASIKRAKEAAEYAINMALDDDEEAIELLLLH